MRLRHCLEEDPEEPNGAEEVEKVLKEASHSLLPS